MICSTIQRLVCVHVEAAALQHAEADYTGVEQGASGGGFGGREVAGKRVKGARLNVIQKKPI
ncbi:MAG: hypothetical protein Q8J72_10405 [Rhodocyclaceae bacterium]|nr:hypothetical protein [Rhodocyclaceae bacterium]